MNSSTMSKNREHLYEGHINMYPPAIGNEYMGDAVRPINDGTEKSEAFDHGSMECSAKQSVNLCVGSSNASEDSFNEINRCPGSQIYNIDDMTTPWVSTPTKAENLEADACSGQFQASVQQQVREQKVRNRPLSEYSEEALQFYKVYETTVNDAPNFTPYIQFAWFETLLQYAFKPSFISMYSINAEKLKRELTPIEVQQNKMTIIEHALKVLNKLIMLKHAPSIYAMGTLYSHQPYFAIDPNNLVPKDDCKALDYYKIAAKLENADGCYRAGVSYEYGCGVSANMSRRDRLIEAVKYYESGAALEKDQMGRTCSMYKLGIFKLNGLIDDESGTIIIAQDINSAMELFERATQSQTFASPQALFELAKIYEFDGLSPELQKAMHINNISRDHTKALELYIKCACKYNYALAQWKLGHCYEFGELNLPRSPTKSIAWYHLSATSKPRGNAMAMISLSGWYLTGIPDVLVPNDTEAFKWALKSSTAAGGKLAKAEFGLGLYYENGIGCIPDFKKSMHHYKNAAKLGHRRAIERLNNAPAI